MSGQLDFRFSKSNIGILESFSRLRTQMPPSGKKNAQPRSATRKAAQKPFAPSWLFSPYEKSPIFYCAKNPHSQIQVPVGCGAVHTCVPFFGQRSEILHCMKSSHVIISDPVILKPGALGLTLCASQEPVNHMIKINLNWSEP